MQELNWGAFKAKFSSKEQATFESLCYMLFCEEHGRPFGIFRYKNQVGIETEPIRCEGLLIGFQAKFYDTPIRDNKDDIIDSLRKAKTKNSDLSRVFVYLNREFSESTQSAVKKPIYIKEIEAAAAAIDVEVEWKVPSHLEIQLAKPENRHIEQHFFSLDRSLIDFVNALTLHTEAVLSPIRSAIDYGSRSITIDRSDAIQQIKSASAEAPVVILAGTAGVGKTAVIKDFCAQLDKLTPCYVFKSAEFNLPSINDLFGKYGSFGLIDFLDLHSDIGTKYVVIDSAERLSDVDDISTLQEFLSTLLANNWRIVFTTRFSYLSDLRFHFLEVYRIAFTSVVIEQLSAQQLSTLANDNKFQLPTNPRMLRLLRVPFYLGEYLQAHGTNNASLSFEQFKNQLWDSQISKSEHRKENVHRRREECFLAIASSRAETGQLFIRGDGLDHQILALLEADEIIQFDKAAAGYFITHDIYEEWALAKLLDRAFLRSRSYVEFFQAIGSSLAIRRAFRTWLGERLLIAENETSSLIQSTVGNPLIDAFWKDEICVSVLLSDYSVEFLSSLESKLLEQDQRLFIRLLFLLRIACKDIDEEFLRTLGITTSAPRAIQVFFTRPRGSGWHAVIAFIFTHCQEWQLNHINAILPVLLDWTSKHKSGDTTMMAGRIALYYYHELARVNGIYGHRRDDLTDQLLRTILQSAGELKAELQTVFEQVLAEEGVDHRHPYFLILERVFTSITDAAEVVRTLPTYVLKLAGLFWSRSRSRNHRNSNSSIDIEQYFGLRNSHFDYFPSSALQTPIFLLLREAPNDTIDFIVTFTNKAVEHYARSGLDGTVEQVQLFLDDSKPTSQYISNRLWNTYRGTQVSTYLLESMHMALEKWLLEVVKGASTEDSERWCLSILQNAKSSSLTAVVASVVQAYPYKLAHIALILFRTKEFFHYDTARFVLDQTQKNNLLVFGKYFPTRWENEIHEHDRLAACDDEHRKSSLEHLALYYQIVRLESESEENSQERREAIWRIFDRHYSGLPDRSKETPADKTWRLFLARMDSRKMTPSAQTIDGQQVIAFTPEIDPELKDYSERSLQENAAVTKHMPLRFWSESRFQNNRDKYSKYNQFESNPQLVIQETREILKELTASSGQQRLLLDATIPAYACAVLIRDMRERLSPDELRFCRDIILQFASMPLETECYHYQVGDGTEPAIAILPYMIKCFPEVRADIISRLVLLLLSPWDWISVFAIRSILYSLWKTDPSVARSCLVGYLVLKPKYEAAREEIRRENYKRKVYEFSEAVLVSRFRKKYGMIVKRIACGGVGIDEVSDVQSLDFHILNTGFQLLPLTCRDAELEQLLEAILDTFARSLYIENRHGEEKIDHTTMSSFLEKLAHLTLLAPPTEVARYLQPFIDNFQASKAAADLLREFISAEDQLNRYDSFWTVWDMFYNKVSELISEDHQTHHTIQILHNYLLAWQFWKKDARSWHSLKDREKWFFRKVAEQMGHHPAVLYSLAKLLNDIGSNFLSDGIEWVANIIDKNKNLASVQLETNTVYYLETMLRRYILTNRRAVKTVVRRKQQILVILEFLVERGSMTAYLLREDMLRGLTRPNPLWDEPFDSNQTGQNVKLGIFNRLCCCGSNVLHWGVPRGCQWDRSHLPVDKLF